MAGKLTRGGHQGRGASKGKDAGRILGMGRVGTVSKGRRPLITE